MNQAGFTHIEMLVNGRTARVFVDIRKSLLEVLREDLGLTGSKMGCGGRGMRGMFGAGG
jgi:aerobic-type carbon monoxide dehydrogenase small subunit (CoxS/CutS family)